MKKILSTLLIAVLMVAAVLTLTACKPSGKYKAELLGTTYEFSGSKFTISMSNSLVETEGTSGTFKMVKEDDVEYIEFTYLNDDGEKIGEPARAKFGEGKDDNGKYITLDGIKFYKQ